MKLRISSLSVSDLDNTGSLLDKQDPAVKLTLGSSTYETSRQKDAGTNTNFPEVFEHEIDSANLNKLRIVAEVHNMTDKNTSKAMVGRGEFPVADYLSSSKTAMVNLPLVTKGGKQKGMFVCRLEAIGDDAKPPSDSQPKPVGESLPQQAAVVAASAKAADAKEKAVNPVPAAVAQKNPADAKDSLLAQLSPDAVSGAKDDYVPDAGRIKAPTRDKILDAPVVEKGAEGIDAPAQRPAEQKSSISEKLLEPSSNKGLVPAPAPATSVANAASPAASAPVRLRISGLRASELTNTGGMLDGQDPAVRITVGSVVKETARSMDAGTQASFVEAFEFDVSAAEAAGQIKLEVLNMSEGNKKVKAVIGTVKRPLAGLVAAAEAGGAAGADLELPLFSPTVKKQQGKLWIHVINAALAQLAQQKPAVTAESVASAKLANSDAKTQSPAEGPALEKKADKAPEKQSSGLSNTQDAKNTIPAPEPVLAPVQPMQPQSAVRAPAPATSVANAASPAVSAPVRLRISGLRASELTNTGGMLDGQDPAVRITVGSVVKETARSMDAGTQASFVEAFEFDVSAAEAAGQIKLEVLNMSEGNKKVKAVIGTVERPLAGLLAAAEAGGAAGADLELPLFSPTVKKQQGKLWIHVTNAALTSAKNQKQEKEEGTKKITSDAAEKVIPIQNDESKTTEISATTNSNSSSAAVASTPVRLRISGLRAAELTNTGGMLDGQDPAVRITVGSVVKDTERAKDAGTEASFPDEFEFSINPLELKTLEARIVVLNMSEGNKKVKAVIGTVERPLAGLLAAAEAGGAAGADLELPLFSPTVKKQQGKLWIHVANPNVSCASIKIPAAQKEGEKISTTPTSSTPEIAKAQSLNPVLQSAGDIVLRIRAIKASNLAKVELIGKNDPFVTLKIKGIFEGKTTTSHDTGSEAEWTYADSDASQMVISTTVESLSASTLDIEVFDENSMLSHALIGKANIVLNGIKSQLNSSGGGEVKLSCELMSAKGKASGNVQISIGAQLVQALKQANVLVVNESGLPTSTSSSNGNSTSLSDASKTINKVPFDIGTLRITRVSCFDLKNVEKAAFMGDQNDPYVRMSYGTWEGRTEAIDGGGSNPKWEYLDLVADVTADQINFENLKVQVFDKNMSGDVLIGEGEALVFSLADSAKIGNENEISLSLKDKKGQVTGRVVLTVVLKPVKKMESAEITIAPGFARGVLHVFRIATFDLKNTELMGKQDPYVKIVHGQSAPFKTIVKQDAGSSALWDFLDFKNIVTADSVSTIPLQLEVWDSNVVKDNLIGTAEINVKKAASTIGQEFEFPSSLVGKDGKSQAGRITVYCKVVEEAPRVDESSHVEIPDSLNGLLRIKRLTLSGIKNTEIVGQQDVFAVVNYGEFQHKFPVKEGETVTWSDLTLSMPISSELLRTTHLEISAFDKNFMRKDVLIGKSPKISLTRAAFTGLKGFDVILNGDILSDQKTTGKYEVVFALCPPEKAPDELEVELDFAGGYVHVHKICLSSLLNTELIGRQDPFVKVIIGETTLQTSTLNNAGAEAAWDHLDLKANVTRDQLQSSNIEIQVWDENNSGSTLIGKSISRMTKAGVEIGKPIELSCELHNDSKKGKSVSAGNVTLVISAHPPEKIILPPSFNLSSDFKEGTIQLLSMQAFGLKNTEFIGKQDPFVVVKIGNSFEYKSPTFKNSSSDVLWDDLDVRATVTPQQIPDGFIEFSVYDENAISKNTLIGSGSAPLRRLASRLRKEQDISINLVDAKGKSTGRLAVKAIMSDTIPAVEKKLPEGFKSGILRIIRLRSFNLRNTELVGKQDPYIKLKLGSWSARTFTQDNMGGDCLWDYLDLRCDITAEELTSGKVSLQLEAMDDNTTFDTSIGAQNVSLQRVRTLGEEVEESVELLDANKRPSGRLSVWMVLEERPPEVEPEVSATFTNGYLHIKRICVFDLANREWFGRADPYVSLQLLTWNEKTNTLKDKGGDAIWDFLDYKVDVTADVLKNEKLVLTAKDLNSKLVGDTIIGTGSVSLRKAGASIDKEVEVTVPLFDAKVATKQTGRAVVYMSVHPPENVQYSIKEGFKFGTLNIVRIRTFDLKNTELVGEADPFVVLKFSNWTDKTYTQDDAGGTVLWDFLDMKCDVTDDSIMNTDLEIAAWDENKGRKNAFIGSGSTKILKAAANIGSEVELAVQLLDEKNKNAGRVVIYCNISEESILEIPETFTKGELAITRITASKLKNTEIFGGKPNCYAKVELGKFSQTTTVVNQNGLNPIWDRLDYKTVVSAQTIKAREVTVELWNKNSMLKDVLIGTAQLSLRRAGAKLNKETEIFGDLLDAKGVVTGRATLAVKLKELPADVEPELDLPPTFKNGIVEILRVMAFGLKNKELIGKQDPYIRAVLAEQEERTVTLFDAGSNPIWTDTNNMQFEVDVSILANEKLEVSVMDENHLTGDKSLGSGKASLRRLCPRLNSEVELSVDLTESGVVCGRVVLVAILRATTRDQLIETIPENAIKVVNGLLRIHKVSVHGLKGGDAGIFRGGKQDPYVVLGIDKWSARTDVKDEAGTEATWDNIEDMQTDVTGDILRFKRLNASVFDKNDVERDELLGEGDASLRGLGSQSAMPDADAKLVEIRVKIRDKKGRISGEVRVMASVTETLVKNDLMLDNQADGGLKEGTLEITKIEASKIQAGGLLRKPSPCVELAIGSNWRYSTDMNKSGGKTFVWNPSDAQTKIAIAQLRRDPIRIKIVDGGKVIGQGSVTGLGLIAKEGRFAILKCSLENDNQPAGLVTLQARFRGDEETVAMISAISGNKSMPGNSDGGSAMSSNLLRELQKERDMLKKTMEQHAEMLQKNLLDMKRQLEESKKDIQSGTSQVALDQVKLPNRVSEWRAAHVQAWIAYQMDLPQYVTAFQEASVDGLLLLSYIGDESLNEDLGVTNALHRKKILSSIASLRAKEASLKAHESKRTVSRAENVEQPRVKKSVKPARAPTEVIKSQKVSASVREQNEIERVRLMRDMKAYREAQARAAKKQEGKSNVWKFEYTGADKPRDSDMWAETKSNGHSSAYDLTMAELFNQTGASDGYVGPVRQVPPNLSLDEVISVIKGAMYDTSNRLIRIEEAKRLQAEALDSDLESVENENDYNNLEEIDGTHSNIELEGDFGPPPTYDDGNAASDAVGEDILDSQYEDPPLGSLVIDEASLAPPPYDSSPRKKGTKKERRPQSPKRYDRVGLIFNTIIGLQNNGASWIGQNDKLTRLKLYGALESVLRLKLGWPQFDALWTQLDSCRTGEIDAREFKAYFGDLSSFEINEGIGNLSTRDGTSAMRAFARILYEFCDILRGIGLTVAEIFATFDRNGSGFISLSEFCSLLRTVLGKMVDKKQVYRAYALFDTDNSRTVELNELMLVIYKIWKAQLNELADKISALDERTNGADIDRLIKQRALIKDAIRKNYPREWRDRTERLGSGKLAGPFSSLLSSLQIGAHKNFVSSPTLLSTGEFSPPGSPNERYPSPNHRGEVGPQSPSFGRNEMRRYKLANTSGSTLPSRPGRVLSLPKTVLVNANSMFSAEGAAAVLQKVHP